MPPGASSPKAFVYFRTTVPGGIDQWVPAAAVELLDDVSVNLDGLFVGAQQYIFDERAARLTRQRANRGGATLLASASRTVTTNSLTQTNRNWRGLHCNINVTVFGGGAGLNAHIQGRAPLIAGGTFYDILISTTIVATGFIVIKVYPGIGQIAGGAASDILPYEWRFQMEALDATAHTYQVKAQLVV